MKVAEIDNFLQYLRAERNYSPHTIAAYGNDLTQFAAFLSGEENRGIELASIDNTDIRSWIASLAEAGIGQRSMRRKVQAVRALYKYLMHEGTVEENPAADVELAHLPHRLPTFVREQNMANLLEADIDTTDVTAVRDRLIVMMFYETGMRRSELITLQDKWVDTKTRELRVHGKRDKDRIIPFGTELAQCIEQYRDLRNTAGMNGLTFFTRTGGEPLYPSLVYRIVHDALMQAGGSDKKSPHVLRHSFATAMLNDGARLDSVKELMGHESIATTQIYTHVTLSDLKNNYKLAHPRALKKGG